MKVSFLFSATAFLLASPAVVFADVGSNHGIDKSGDSDVAAFSKLSPDRSSLVANYELRPTSKIDYHGSLKVLDGVCAAEFGPLAIMADFNADVKAMTKEQYNLNLHLLNMTKLHESEYGLGGLAFWITLGGHSTRGDGSHFMMQSFYDQEFPSKYWNYASANGAVVLAAPWITFLPKKFTAPVLCRTPIAQEHVQEYAKITTTPPDASATTPPNAAASMGLSAANGAATNAPIDAPTDAPTAAIDTPSTAPKGAAKGDAGSGARHSTQSGPRKVGTTLTKTGPKGVRGSNSGSNAGKRNKSAVSKGDPHFKTFAGKKFDFHGECDLVLLQHPSFSNRLGLDINIRTKINSSWSYIDSVVIRIGQDTLEVTGGNDGGKHWINGQPGKTLEHGDSFTLAGFMVQVKHLSPKQKQYRVDLGYRNAISLATYKDFVSANVNVKYDSMFVGSRGLMGSYPDGENLARDGFTVLEDPVSFGNEWQVLDSEPMLFHNVEGPQHPEACAMPSTTQAAVETRTKRRLGEAGMTQEDAEIACAHADPEEKDACIFDVLATQDKDLAGSY